MISRLKRAQSDADSAYGQTDRGLGGGAQWEARLVLFHPGLGQGIEVSGDRRPSWLVAELFDALLDSAFSMSARKVGDMTAAIA